MSLYILAKKTANRPVTRQRVSLGGSSISSGHFRIHSAPTTCGCSGEIVTNRPPGPPQYSFGSYNNKLKKKCNIVDKNNVDDTKTMLEYTEEKKVVAILDVSGCPIPRPKTKCGCNRKNHTIHQNPHTTTYKEYLELYKIQRRCNLKKHHSDLFS
tara:strand:- start:251 stop:715 length:465 start_codon:yes stop_codon:yes gene_type:complete